MTQEETTRAIGTLIETAEEMKSAYFFTPPQSAGARRSYEKKHSAGPIEWTEAGHTYTARFITECSCKHVYTRGEYTRDGKKTTLTAIRNSCRRMKAAQEATT